MENKNLKLFFLALIAALAIIGVFFLSKNIAMSEVGNGPASMDTFVSCLNKKEIFLYGSTQDNNVKAQLSLFGNYSEQIVVVDCRANASKCEGIFVFPTWNINGVIVHGSLSLNVLSKFSGC